MNIYPHFHNTYLQGNNGRFFMTYIPGTYTCTIGPSDVIINNTFFNDVTKDSTLCNDVDFPFYIDGVLDIGNVYLRRPLATGGVYTFDVSAHDLGVPSLTSQTNVLVKVVE